MKRIVMLAVHDWPKRTNFSRERIEVDAISDEDAMAKGLAIGAEKFPGGKIKAYDVIKPQGEPAYEAKRTTLKVKAA